MKKPEAAEKGLSGDLVQQRLAGYACDFSYRKLSPDTLHATKTRVIDTLGALLGGFHGEPCELARRLAARVPVSDGVSVVGTRMKTTPDMAAFVNGTTARYVEMNDIYRAPGRPGGHPSDVILPTLAAAEYRHANGREFIAAVTLGYEIYLRMTDAVDMPGFDYTNFVCLGSTVAAGKLFGLSIDGLGHCISIAVVPNNALLQGRKGHLSMWKVMATGQAGRAAIFAAMLAEQGAKGPSLPFEGKAGWNKHVSGKPFSLDTLGGDGVPFKVHETLIKPRPARYVTIPAVLAAEKVAPLSNPGDVTEVTIRSFRRAVEGTDEQHWNPHSRETADHSIPYVVAATLLEGKITTRSFDDDRLRAPALLDLIRKVNIVEDAEFTRAHERSGLHFTRVTVTRRDGSVAVGESGGQHGDLSDRPTDAQIEEKFRSLAEEKLGVRRVKEVLELLWRLEDMDDVSRIASALEI
jgi:2-methylcitrate dehydratase